MEVVNLVEQLAKLVIVAHHSWAYFHLDLTRAGRCRLRHGERIKRRTGKTAQRRDYRYWSYQLLMDTKFRCFMEPELVMRRRRFSREFKIETVKLVRERRVSVAQAGRDLDVRDNVLRKWIREFGSDPAQAFPGMVK
jgi:transposase